MALLQRMLPLVAWGVACVALFAPAGLVEDLIRAAVSVALGAFVAVLQGARTDREHCLVALVELVAAALALGLLMRASAVMGDEGPWSYFFSVEGNQRSWGAIELYVFHATLLAIGVWSGRQRAWQRSAPPASSAVAIAEVLEAEREQLYLRRTKANIEMTAPPVGLALSGGGLRAAHQSAGLLAGLEAADALVRIDYLAMVSGGSWGGLSWLGARRKAPKGGTRSATPADDSAHTIHKARDFAGMGSLVGKVLGVALLLFRALTTTLPAILALWLGAAGVVMMSLVLELGLDSEEFGDQAGVLPALLPYPFEEILSHPMWAPAGPIDFLVSWVMVWFLPAVTIAVAGALGWSAAKRASGVLVSLVVVPAAFWAFAAEGILPFVVCLAMPKVLNKWPSTGAIQVLFATVAGLLCAALVQSHHGGDPLSGVVLRWGGSLLLFPVFLVDFFNGVEVPFPLIETDMGEWAQAIEDMRGFSLAVGCGFWMPVIILAGSALFGVARRGLHHVWLVALSRFSPDASKPWGIMGKQPSDGGPLPLVLGAAHVDDGVGYPIRTMLFIFGPTHVGADAFGYAPACKYSSLNVGDVLAISSAAVATQIGHRAAIQRLLVRVAGLLGWVLGRWVPAPRWAASPAPQPSFLGATVGELWPNHQDVPWLYLTDGGHLDNTGITALVSRGVRQVLSLDSGRDPDYQWADLRKAINLLKQRGWKIVSGGVPPLGFTPTDETCIRHIRLQRCDGESCNEELDVWVAKPFAHKKIDSDPDFPQRTTFALSMPEDASLAYLDLGRELGKQLAAAWKSR